MRTDLCLSAVWNTYVRIVSAVFWPTNSKLSFATSWLAVLAVCGCYNLLTIFSVFHNSYFWDKIVLKMENSMKNQVTLAQAVFDRMLYFLITVKKLR